jgi:hypothetical protein
MLFDFESASGTGPVPSVALCWCNKEVQKENDLISALTNAQIVRIFRRYLLTISMVTAQEQGNNDRQEAQPQKQRVENRAVSNYKSNTGAPLNCTLREL